jgi:hypothetical protein
LKIGIWVVSGWQVLKVFVRSFIDAGVLGAVITLLGLFYRSPSLFDRFPHPGFYVLFYGFPLSYISINSVFGKSINFFNAFLDFVFWFVIAFVIVSLLSLTFQKLGTGKKSLITSLEIEQKNKDMVSEEQLFVFFPRMDEQNTLKLFRLLFIHNLVMTFLLVLDITLYTPEMFWGMLRGWIVFKNILGIASWVYWVVGVVLIFIYSRRLCNPKSLACASSSENRGG